MATARHLLAVLAASVALLAVPAPAQAARITFGSDLRAPANAFESHGADTAFWGTNLPGRRTIRVPRKGQVTTIRVKGNVRRPSGAPPPLNIVHFQILRPRGRGRMQVMLTSGDFFVPVGGSPEQISVYRPINLCARSGDYVAFNDLGGYNPPFYPNGTQFQVFSRGRRGSTTRFFTRNNGTNNGAIFRGRRRSRQELLMQMVLRTGRGVAPPCR